MMLKQVSLSSKAVCLTLELGQGNQAMGQHSQVMLIVESSKNIEPMQSIACESSMVGDSTLKLWVSWNHAYLLFDSSYLLRVKAVYAATSTPMLIPQESLLRVDRHTLQFFVHKVRSPGARAFDEETTLFLAQEAYAWIPPNQIADKASALVVVVYRLLELKQNISPAVIQWVNQEMDWHLLHADLSKLGVNSRWGYSLRIAYFYWKLAHSGPAVAEEFILQEHQKISADFSIESVPNYFKMALVLGAFALIKSDVNQVYRLISTMNSMLTRGDLWQTPTNFFQSLDRKNLVSNYHEVFKLAVVLDPIKLRREWVQEYDMSIDTTFIGDPGRHLVRTILGEHGIKYR